MLSAFKVLYSSLLFLIMSAALAENHEEKNFQFSRQIKENNEKIFNLIFK